MVEMEWNTPTLGFDPNWESMTSKTQRLSLPSVGMLRVRRGLTAFQPWLRRSKTKMSNRSARSDQYG